MLTFEYDDTKSHKNLSKHGIDFDAAQALWSDPGLLEIPAKTVDEPRFIVMALLQKNTGQQL